MSYQRIDNNSGIGIRIADPNMGAAVIALEDRIESLKTDQMDVNLDSYDGQAIRPRIDDLSMIYGDLIIGGDPDGTVAVIENRIQWIKDHNLDPKRIKQRIADPDHIRCLLMGQDDQ